MNRLIFSTLLALCNVTVVAAEPLYVAVGYGGRRMTSSDGVIWENVQQWADKGGDDSNNLMSVAFGKGKFVCVGGGGFSKETQAGHILVSTDGKEWREVAKYPFRVNPVLFLGDRFAAGGPSKQLLTSLDGEKWEEGEKVTLPPEIPGYAFWFRVGAAGNGVFAFMGNAGKDQKTWWCLTSRDGKKIEQLSLTAPGKRGLAFGAGKFVAVDAKDIFYSTDAREWVPAPDLPEDEYRGIIWSGKGFILTGKAATYSSPDGLTWKPFGKAPPGNIQLADERGFIASGWPGKMFFSADGQTWKPAGQPQPAMGINKVVGGAPAEPAK
jgi:hypothetical protein